MMRNSKNLVNRIIFLSKKRVNISLLYLFGFSVTCENFKHPGVFIVAQPNGLPYHRHGWQCHRLPRPCSYIGRSNIGSIATSINMAGLGHATEFGSCSTYMVTFVACPIMSMCFGKPNKCSKGTLSERNKTKLQPSHRSSMSTRWSFPKSWGQSLIVLVSETEI